MANYHVIRNRETDKWYIKKENAMSISAKANTQLKAEKIAKKFCYNTGGGEVKIHGLDGKIRDSDTVAPGNDPCPPLDKKY